MEKIKVLVVDDHHVVRQGIAALINSVDDMVVVAEGANGRQGVELFTEHRPDVTIMDLRLPVLSGVEAITQIRQQSPTAKIIVLTTFDGDEDIYRALQAGARGYLLKDMFGDDLMDAIRVVHAGKSRIPAAIAQRLADRMGGPELTPRELDVLRLIVGGNSNKEIGQRLFISEATVKTHINSLLSKLHVTDRTQAATTALQRGIVHLPNP
jgi:DNA-binding NarL/FixJ family response regulator